MAPHEALSFLQSWLFFGLLTEVFRVGQVEFNIDDFVTEDGYVTTKCLPDLLRVWMYNERNMLEEGRNERSREVHGMLSEVSFLTMGITLEHGHKKPGKEDFFAPFSINDVKTAEVVLLSITILGEALMKAKRIMLTEDPWRGLSWPTIEILKERLREAGWCPNEIKRMRGHDEAGLLYLGNLSRQEFMPKHHQCSIQRCTASDTDETSYLVRHVNQFCDCEHIGLDMAAQEQMSHLLSRGEIPVVGVTQHSATMPPRIGVWNSGMFQPVILYVAISHVWSEGMGNPRRNSLPRCQLYKLQTRVNALYNRGKDGSIPFWIDTLCVPLKQNARKQAISMMRKTFENADAVLVFDSSLLPYSVHTSSEEVMMRISHCRWVTRLWTFQEGVLARRLLFQFSDGATSIEELMERYFADQRTKDVRRFPTLRKDSQFFRLLAEEVSLDAKSARTRSFKTARLDSVFAGALGLLKFIDGTLLKHGELHERIAALTKALSDRATSKAEDETICLAGLLNLGDNVVVKLLDTPAEERMVRLMSSIDVFPSDFIFGDSPRILGVPGCGWMPTSLLNTSGNATLAMGDEKALRCSAGLVVTFPGLRLQDPNARPTTVTHGGNRMRVLIAIEGRVYQTVLTPTAGKWHGYPISQLGLILRHPIVDHTPVQAVLVADCHDGVANVILCKYYAFGWIWPVPQDELDEHGLGMKNCIPSRSQPSMQQWCIG